LRGGLSIPVAWATGIVPGLGVPLRIVIDGVVYERVSLAGRWLAIDGQPVYMEI
jgi:hypothetical protein